MLPFFNTLRNPKNTTQKRPPKNLKELTKDLGDVEQLSQHDVANRFWLSEPAFDALEHMAKRQGNTISSMLRVFYAVHCYGTYVVSEMLEQDQNLFKDSSDVQFSKAFPPRGFVSQTIYFVPELGKNVAPIKVWLAKAQKEDLALLAQHTGLTLSEYCREIVTARLLGHGTLPMRPEMLAASPNASVIAWEANEEASLEYRRVEESEFANHRFGHTASEWVRAEDAADDEFAK